LFRSLIRRDLIDEYRVRLVPSLAGKGTRLFSVLEGPATLELVSATPAGSAARRRPGGCKRSAKPWQAVGQQY
jgi:dihydrofolate reductase